MSEPRTDGEHFIHFVFRSKWNVVGLVVGAGVAYAIWLVVESVKWKIVLAVTTFVMSFIVFMAIGIRKEYRDEDKGA